MIVGVVLICGYLLPLAGFYRFGFSHFFVINELTNFVHLLIILIDSTSFPSSLTIFILRFHSWVLQVFWATPSWASVQLSLVFWHRKGPILATPTTRARVLWTWCLTAPCCSSSRASPRSTGRAENAPVGSFSDTSVRSCYSCVLSARLQRLQAITCGQGLSSASLRRVHTTPNTMTNLVLPTPPGPSECLICSELALLVLFCPCQHSVACEGVRRVET